MNDIDKLVELVSNIIFERLNSGDVKVAALGEIPQGLIVGADVKVVSSYADIRDCDYIVISSAKYHELHSGNPHSNPQATASTHTCADKVSVIDLRDRRLVHERCLRDLNIGRGDLIEVSKSTMITALAHDYAKHIGAKIQR